MTATAIETTRPRKRGDMRAVLEALSGMFGNRFSASAPVREQHGSTLTWIANQPPDAVVWPNSTDEVVDVVKLCAAHCVPVIAYGAGTSLEGHVNAPEGGISLDFSNMNRIIEVNPEDLDCRVEAGVTR
ncbi:MAG: FAD-binding oxidoreductase, partial [Alphaproteobacteria bacterium]